MNNRRFKKANIKIDGLFDKVKFSQVGNKCIIKFQTLDQLMKIVKQMGGIARNIKL